MKKKMTLKEFKRVLEEEGGMYFDVWGYEGILNLIILAKRHTAKLSEDLGCKESSKLDRKGADAIERYLENIGYYDSTIL